MISSHAYKAGSWYLLGVLDWFLFLDRLSMLFVVNWSVRVITHLALVLWHSIENYCKLYIDSLHDFAT